LLGHPKLGELSELAPATRIVLFRKDDLSLLVLRDKDDHGHGLTTAKRRIRRDRSRLNVHT